MNKDFEKMPDSSRVWIYQSDKELNEKEKSLLNEQLSSFISSWESHGHPLSAAAKIVDNQFLILAVDESVHAASGCSIDTSVNFLKSLEQTIGANFFERSLIPFKIGGKITLFKLDQLKELIKASVIKPDTLLLNTSLSDLAGFKSNWEQAAANSWISRYFK
jgi:DNA phosphorothioation-dependent restriction protein DptG